MSVRRPFKEVLGWHRQIATWPAIWKRASVAIISIGMVVFQKARKRAAAAKEASAPGYGNRYSRTRLKTLLHTKRDRSQFESYIQLKYAPPIFGSSRRDKSGSH